MKRKNIAKFWYDVSIAAGQVTFGVIAASWFVPPFDAIKKIVLLVNIIFTIILLVNAYKSVKKL